MEKRSPEAIERRRIAERERYRRRYQDPAFRAAELERGKAKYAKNIAREKKRSREYYHANKDRENKQRAEWRAKHKERARDYARKYYAANRGRVIELVRQYKIRNDPSHGLFAAVTGFERGDLSFEQFVEIYGERIALLDDLFKPEA